MHLLNKFLAYYTWMAYIPLAVCIFSTMDAWRKLPPRVTAGCFLLVATAVLVGWPLRMLATACEWKERNYRAAELMAELAPRGAWIYADYAAYFAAKRLDMTIVLPPYLQTISEAEK